MLTDVQQNFIQLEKKKAEIKKYFDDLEVATKAVANEVGVDGFFQDPTDGTVYQIVKPAGTFISFKEVDFIRTRRGYLGEVKADLSMKKAEEAGYLLNDNQKKVIKFEE